MRPPEPVVVVLSDEAEPRVPRYLFRAAARWPARTAGIAITAIVHLLLSTPMLLGYSGPKNPSQPQTGPGSVEYSSRGEQVESMILLDLSALTPHSPDPSEQPQFETDGIQLEELEIVLASLEPSPPLELVFEDADEIAGSTEAAGNPAGAAALFGRYMGQVSTRIERAWMRPRTPIEGGVFTCRAAVVQDRTGNVISLELQDCGNDERWRASLRSAILRASPLLAPPEPWLFTPRVTLTFTADQYVAGRTPEYRYEPASPRMVVNRGNVSDSRPPAPGEAGDFELTIDGSDVRWRRKNSGVATRN